MEPELELTAASLLGAPTALWISVAVFGWLLALAAAYLAGRERLGRIAGPPASTERISQTLGWLRVETEGDAAAYFEMGPGGSERMWVEPEGLDQDTLGEVVGLARAALVSPGDPAPGDDAARWLGAGGSKCIVVTGATAPTEEPLRFARYLLEASRGQRVPEPTRRERRVRALGGVAWAEESNDGATIRVVLAAGAPLSIVREIEGMLGPEVRVELVSPTVSLPDEVAPLPGPTPRVREGARPGIPRLSAGVIDPEDARILLTDVAIDGDGRSTADVRVLWKDQELRGRGHGRASTAGRYFAAAEAVADALRPLLDTDIVVEGLYSASTEEGTSVLIAAVQLEGRRLIGAVYEPSGEPGWAGARAVLDAVNRRLTQVAGRSGRI